MTSKPDGIAAWTGVAAMAAIVAACAAAFLGIFAMDAGMHVALIALWLIAGFGFGSVVIPGKGLNAVTATAIGIGWMGLIFHGLGLAGWLDQTTVIGLVAVGDTIAVFRFWRARKSPRERAHPWSLAGWIILAIPLVMGLVAASCAPGFLWRPIDPHPYDALSYHLQVPREWYEAGRIIPLEHNAFSFFPMLMETHYLAAMHALGGPWKAMYLCQYITLAHAGLAIWSLYAIARALGAPAAIAWSGAAIAAYAPWTIMLAGVCYVESGVMLYALLAAGWVAISLKESSPRAWLVVGACAGLACGMKYTAFAMVAAPVVAMWGLLTISRASQIRHALLAGMLTLLVASPWLVRNYTWTGNPVFPLASGVFGQGHFTDNQVDRYVAAHRPPDAEATLPARLRSAIDRTLLDGQFDFALIPVSLIAVGCWVVRRDRAGAFVLLVIVATTAVWIGFTHVMPRFLTTLIPLIALLITVCIRHKAVAMSLAGAVIAWGIAWIGPRWLQAASMTEIHFLPDFTVMEDQVVESARMRGGKLALVGEAQAFLYQFPSDRLLYRSVFDVNIPTGVQPEDGWLGTSVERLRRDGYTVVINFEEINRLQSYRHISPTAGRGIVILPPQ